MIFYCIVFIFCYGALKKILTISIYQCWVLNRHEFQFDTEPSVYFDIRYFKNGPLLLYIFCALVVLVQVAILNGLIPINQGLKKSAESLFLYSTSVKITVYSTMLVLDKMLGKIKAENPEKANLFSHQSRWTTTL